MFETMNTQTVDIEDFMSDFNITCLATQKDEGLLSKDSCRRRILNTIKLNIQHFRNDTWSAKNQMYKLLIDLDEQQNASIFTVRLGGKRIYRCSCPLFSITKKIQFLERFYEAVSRGVLDKQIEAFCEKEVRLTEQRKEKQREKQRQKRAYIRLQRQQHDDAERQAVEEAKQYMPHFD